MPANKQENSSTRSFSPTKSEIGCVIMASGLAKRFGSNKLLAEFDRKPLLCRAFAVTEGLHRVVVTRSTEVQTLCKKYGIPVLHHAHPLRSDTVRLGLEYLLPRFPAMSGCVFLPGDQPLLTRETLCGMVSAFCAEPDRKSQIFRLCEPQSGTPGSPVLFGADYFEELRSLPEGRGGGVVVKRHAEKITLFPARHPAELMDADTPDVLAELKTIFQNDSFYR